MRSVGVGVVLRVAPGVVAGAGVLLLALWLTSGRHTVPLPARLPEPETVRPVTTGKVNLAGVFLKSAGVPASLPGSWPRFRGERLDGISTETSLAQSWAPAGPKPLWSIALGEGYAGAAVLGGRVYVLDYDQAARRDALRCLSLADGGEIWRRSYPVKIKRNHGMSRTVPAVTAKYVVTLGPKCHVLCCDAQSGKYLWGMDLVRQFRTRVPLWYAGQCPLIDGGRAILAPGGTALMIAVDCATGKVLWKAPNPRGWGMSHSSILPMTLRGRKTYVYCAAGGVVGVDANCGAILWETDAWKISIATVPTPVHVGGGRIFLTGGYGAGCMMLQVAQEGGRFVPKPLYRLEAREFCSEQQTPILLASRSGLGERLLSVLAKGGPISQQLACMSLEGKVLWTSGIDNQYGLGPFLVAGDLLFALKDNGQLTLAQVGPRGMKVLAQAKVLYKQTDKGLLPGTDAWGPMALVDGRLIVRDLARMVCLDVRAGG